MVESLRVSAVDSSSFSGNGAACSGDLQVAAFGRLLFAAQCIMWHNECKMPVIQVRDVPDHIYRLLAEQAEKERRSLAQQVVAVLARGLQVELGAKSRRQKVLQSIHAGGQAPTRRLSDPARLIRKDRRR